ncbi:MAG: response regulator [Thermodesulfovibrio sp.]|nr:response regulator [Thermodesulfovibrio sp.]
MKAKILIVDDSPLVRKLAEVSLQEAGYEVYTASDGEEGLRVAEVVKPELILVDFIMPKMTGSQFCKILKENKDLKDIPIILITGKGETVGQAFIEKYSVLDYIIKPFKSEELVEKIDKILSEIVIQKETVEEIFETEPFSTEEVEIFFEESEYEEQKLKTAEQIEEYEKIEETPELEKVLESEEIPEFIEPRFEETEIQEIKEELLFEDISVPEEAISESEEVLSVEETKVEEFEKTEEVPSIPEISEEISQKPIFFDLEAIEKIIDDKFMSILQNIDYSIEGIMKKYGLVREPSNILHGTVSYFKLQDIFLFISSNKLTGLLYFYGKGTVSEFLFIDGMIVYGISNLQKQKISNKLLKDLNNQEIKEITIETLNFLKRYSAEFFSFEKKDLLDYEMLNKIKYNPIELFSLIDLT